MQQNDNDDLSSDDDSYQAPVIDLTSERFEELDDEGNVDYLARFRCSYSPPKTINLRFLDLRVDGQGFTHAQLVEFLNQLRHAVRVGSILKIKIDAWRLELESRYNEVVRQVFGVIAELEEKRGLTATGGLVESLSFTLHGPAPSSIGKLIRVARGLDSLTLETWPQVVPQPELVYGLHSHPSLTSLDLSFHSYLQVDRVNRREYDSLWAAISTLPKLSSLRLSSKYGIYYGQNGSPSCCPFSNGAIKDILQLPALTKLDLHNFFFSKADCRALGEGLIGAGTQLNKLSLRGCKFSEKESAHRALFDGIRRAPCLSCVVLEAFPFPDLPSPEVYSMLNRGIESIRLGNVMANAAETVFSGFNGQCALKDVSFKWITPVESKVDSNTKLFVGTIGCITKLAVRCPALTTVNVVRCGYIQDTWKLCPEAKTALRDLKTALLFNKSTRNEMAAANTDSDRGRALDLLAGCSSEVNCLYRGIKMLPILFDKKGRGHWSQEGV